MNEQKEKKRINILDILIILVVVLVIVAFFFRSEIRNLFAKKGDAVITFSFEIASVDPQTASGWTAGTKLYDETGNVIGDVLDCRSENAANTEALTDGTVVSVENGRKRITGNVTAKGYINGDFKYLNNGTMLVAGDRMNISTGDMFFEILILSVNAQ